MLHTKNNETSKGRTTQSKSIPAKCVPPDQLSPERSMWYHRPMKSYWLKLPRMLGNWRFLQLPRSGLLTTMNSWLWAFVIYHWMISWTIWRRPIWQGWRKVCGRLKNKLTSARGKIKLSHMKSLASEVTSNLGRLANHWVSIIWLVSLKRSSWLAFRRKRRNRLDKPSWLPTDCQLFWESKRSNRCLIKTSNLPPGSSLLIVN